ncbi:CPBP family intramembrane glutamic endopeptidase [Natrialba magadii]|nr:type II CAAX endopeptidase family protein [Natrialba magadii]
MAIILGPTATEFSLAEAVGIVGFQLLVAVILVVIALGLATRLDGKPIRAYGLESSATWARDFLAGIAISAVGSGLAFGYLDYRGYASISVEVSGLGVTGGPFVVSSVLVVLLGYVLANNVYEEVVFRGIMLPNFTEGLEGRGLSPTLAVVLAAVGSLFVFGLWHIPLGAGNPIPEVITSFVIGIAFTLAYLFTGRLGLPIGVHFGGVFLEGALGTSFLGLELPTLFVLEAHTTVTYEFSVVRALLVSLLVVGWVRLTYGDVRIHEAIYQSTPVREENSDDT